jgi:DNA-binding MarR family transcriptional regulator
VTVSDIAAALNVALPTATVALKKLEGKGLITRAPCADDGRRSLISLTEHGAKLNKAHAYFHKKLVQGISSGFTEEEKAILLTATEKLYEYFKEKADNNEY